jgi:hypothetical protein
VVVRGSACAPQAASIEPLSVPPAKDGPLTAFAHRQVDRASSPWDQRDRRWLAALPKDAECPVASFEAEVLDVRGAGFADPQPVQTEQHRKRGVVAVVLLGGEQEHAKIRAVETAGVRRVHLRSADILRRVRGDAPVNVSEAVEAAHRRQPPVDRRCRQALLLHPASEQLDVWARGRQHSELHVGRPLEEPAQVVPVRVQRVAAVASQETNGGELRIIDDEIVARRLDCRRCRVDRGHGCSPSSWEN